MKHNKLAKSIIKLLDICGISDDDILFTGEYKQIYKIIELFMRLKYPCGGIDIMHTTNKGGDIEIHYETYPYNRVIFHTLLINNIFNEGCGINVTNSTKFAHNVKVT